MNQLETSIQFFQKHGTLENPEGRCTFLPGRQSLKIYADEVGDSNRHGKSVTTNKINCIAVIDGPIFFK